MYPGQVIRSVVYSGPRGTYRTEATLFNGIIVHMGFPWIKCYRLQTQGSQRTRRSYSMGTLGDGAVHTPFPTGLNEVMMVRYARPDMGKVRTPGRIRAVGLFNPARQTSPNN